MKQVPSDKYNIAWFKLAECVARGEKERALGVYRLLSHSLDDHAFARQLEGDILRSFNDEAACACYEESAALYQNDNRLLQAAAVYEHMRMIDSNHPGYCLALADLHELLGARDKRAECLVEHVCLLIKHAAEPPEVITSHLKKAVEACSALENNTTLQKFLSRLEQLSSEYHEQARSYL